MRTFNKGPAPRVVAEHDARWQRERAAGPVTTITARTRFDDLDKSLPRVFLGREQGGLCAFCLGRIRPVSPVSAASGTVLAHVVPLREDCGRIFEWTNLVGACPGGTRAAPHCDRAQGQRRLHVNPALAPVALEDHVHYASDGALRYCGPPLFGRAPDEIQAEFDEVLCLNTVRLRENRAAILDEARARLPQGKGSWSEPLLRAEMAWWTARVEIRTDPPGEPPLLAYRPYFCVALAYLKKKLRAALA